MKQPRLLQTRLGACIEELIEGEVQDGESRVISGSILSGRHAAGWSAYLGRHHMQVCVIPEGVERALMGWFTPGRRTFSQSKCRTVGSSPVVGSSKMSISGSESRARTKARRRFMPPESVRICAFRL